MTADRVHETEQNEHREGKNMKLTAMRFQRKLLMASWLIVVVLLLVCGGMAPAADQPAPEKPLPELLTVDLGGNVTMEFVLARPGAFTMGDKDSAECAVTLTQPFYIGKYEVTQEQWEKVMGSNPSHFKGAKNPVETVSWDDCQKFLAKLKEKDHVHQFALPTEAQWEYACRAGTTTDPDNLYDYAWSGDTGGVSHPVGQKKPNAWGLYDIHGNVREWCQDWYAPYPEHAQTDPTGPATGKTRVARGGSFAGYYEDVRSVCRRAWRPAESYDFIGLRCVVVVSKEPAAK